jgi:DMSO/TMAO reductase YedYZ molybdopterin-dependent catalytic subunit
MKYFEKPGADLADRVPPGQHLAKGFPVLTYGETPQVTPDAWSLTISGLAAAKTFTWADLMALPQQDFTADFHCVTTWSKLDVKWTGVAMPDLMAQITLPPDAAYVMMHCYGDYTTNLALGDFVRPENFLAHTLFGEPLPPDHGGQCGWWCPISTPGRVPSGFGRWNSCQKRRWAFGNATAITAGVNPGQKNAIAIADFRLSSASDWGGPALRSPTVTGRAMVVGLAAPKGLDRSLGPIALPVTVRI